MLSFWFCFLSFFYTVNSFSTEEKQEEEIKCYSCNNTIIKIEKEITKNEKEKNANDKEEKETEENDEPNYTVKKPFASLSCIFNCKCNSFFLCKNCYEKNKKKMAKCPNCKNNKKQSLENTDNVYKDLNCNICTKKYIDIKLASCSYFYNCSCNGFICKGCYDQWTKKEKEVKKEEEKEHKCPICKTENNHKGIDYVITKDQKNCCQICTEYIKDFFIDC